ncbi:unnamed protein product [Cyclocybe aegerita]|uniref:FAD dependent oxidoreductase domain-containing protein n=1 Tax=Cyclocybe aegerita TaxID=1973307 RepID=A0A8S0WS10_CYCAE|nr:unnamed protein product [Cyclocybe aegerita]
MGYWCQTWQYWFPRYQDVKSDASHRPLIVLGGGRNQMKQGTTDDSVLNSQVEKVLKAFLPWFFPKQFRKEDAENAREMQWHLSLGWTRSASWVSEGQYIAAGFSGHDMPRTFSCAEAVADMITAKIRGEEWTTPDYILLC